MKKFKDFLKEFFIDGLSGMATGLFATLIIGTIVLQIGTIIPGEIGRYVTLVGKVAQMLTGAGIGCGVYAWGAAAGGTVAFCCVAFLLSRTGLGTKHFFDGMLRFALPNEGPVREQVEHIMKTSLKTFILITMREVDGGARLDVAYQVRLRATKPAAEILNELSKLEGISDVQFMMQDATTEM